MAKKKRSTTRKRTLRSRAVTRLPSSGEARLKTRRVMTERQARLDLGYGDYQVPLFSSAELHGVKAEKRPFRSKVTKIGTPKQAQLFQNETRAGPRSICETRAVRKEVIFATGQGGRPGQQRPHKPKTKVRC